VKLKKSFAQKLLVFLLGLLLVLVGTYYQLKSQKESTPETSEVLAQKEEARRELIPRLKASLVQQSRNLQRCWLQNAKNPDEQIWQVFVEVASSGKVSQFRLLNATAVDPATLKCLTETGTRMKFPTFDGESFSFTIPIVMTRN
jgi:hypothetical protein